jgi:hypothetical protein
MIDLKNYHYRLNHDDTLEEVLCLATLIASGMMPININSNDAKMWFDKLPEQDCGNCPCFKRCLACIINE